MKPVLNKIDFYRRFHAGEFGNRGIMWDSLDDWRKSKFRGDVAIRTKGIGTRCDYDIPWMNLEVRWREFLSEGYSPEAMNISAMLPHSERVIQGELTRSPRGLELFASRDDLPMRQSLRENGFCLLGLAALNALKGACDPPSLDWLMYLLDAYDDHTVEFSTIRKPWGTLNLNTVIWEVRAY